MNLKQLKYVITLANAGSFSKAANILNISQPSLSQYIKKIEEQLGVELFDRMGGYVKVTDAGQVYIEIGRKILDLENQMKNRFFDVSSNQTGSIIIGTTPYRSSTFMPYVAAEFKKAYPGIKLIINEFETHSLIEAASRGEFDLCLISLPVDERTFDFEVVTEEELIIAVPSNGELDAKLKKSSQKMSKYMYPAIDAKILHNAEFVTVYENLITQHILDNLCADHNITIKSSAIVKSFETQIEFVRAGLGGALIPAGIAKIGEYNRGINYYSVIQGLPKRKVGVVYSKNKYVSEPMKYIIKIMKGCD